MYTSLSTAVQANTKAVGTSTSLQKRAAGYQRAWYPAALESRVHFCRGRLLVHAGHSAATDQSSQVYFAGGAAAKVRIPKSLGKLP